MGNKKFRELFMFFRNDYVISGKPLFIIRGLTLFASFLVVYLNFESIYYIDPYEIKDLFFHMGGLYSLVSFLLIVILFLTVFMIIGNLFISYVFISIVSLIIGIANLYFLKFRNTFLTIAEIKNYKEALKLNIDISLLINPYVILLIFLNILIGIMIFRLKYPSINGNLSRVLILSRFVIVGLCIFFTGLFIRFFGFEILICNDRPGAILTLCLETFRAMDVGNENLKVADIEKEYMNSGTSNNENLKCPNIIVIMSEAFWDTNNFKDGFIGSDRDPMEEFYKLEKESLTGECGVDIFGGGTIQSEIEFNTGMYLGNPFGIDCDWRNFIDNKYKTFVTYLNDMGYYSAGFHPYEGSFYDREKVYPNMGFMNFYDEDDFKYNNRCFGYISDMSLSKELIYRFKEQKSIDEKQPVYFFAVSLQNHIIDLQYNGENDDYKKTINVEVNDTSLDEKAKNEITKYENGIALSVEALKELITFFRSYPQDTMIVFFGDHAPKFSGTENDIYKKEHMYKTPYLIWTNYDNDYNSYGDINLSYLSSIIIDYLDMPDTLIKNKNMYMLNRYKLNTLYDKEFWDNSEKSKKKYLSDMTNEKAVYSFYRINNKECMYLWTR